MNVVSTFDGIRCGYLALERAGIKVNKYFAIENDKTAIRVGDKNFPDAINLGDINFITKDVFALHKIDLYIGGSPCQSFSRGGNGTGFKGKSGLFWEYARLLRELREVNPDILFLLENVRMKKEHSDIITEELGVEPIKINSKLVSAQTRDRLYWTNIKDIQQPEDKNIHIREILGRPRKPEYISFDYIKNSGASFYVDAEGWGFWRIPEATKGTGYVDIYRGQAVDLTFINSKTRRGRAMFEKSNCITASSQLLCVYDGVFFRKFTAVELEKLQTLPFNYTEGESDTQRRKMIGNGWNVDTIAHIFKHIKK